MILERQVTGSGPGGGIVIVGEAPSWEELKEGKPFVGPAGRILRYHLSAVGLHPDHIRFENVIERKLPDNKIDSLFVYGLPGEELQAWWGDLAERLSLLKPRVILACGQTALDALLQRTDHPISQSHCYVLSEPNLPPIVPAYHPAFIFRRPDWAHWLDWAIRKAMLIARGRALDPQPTLHIEPTFPEAISWLEAASLVEEVAIDIEATTITHEMTCFSVALSPTQSMSIPLATYGLTPYWPLEEEREIWLALDKLLAAPCKKIMQNFIFDTLMLSHLGLQTSGPFYDTLIVANLLNPELPKGLDDLARLYCYCQPWKTSRDWNLTGDPRDHWLYNANDSAKTFQIAVEQRRELAARNLTKFYDTHTAPLLPLVLDTCTRGIRVDKDFLAQVDHRLGQFLTPIREQLGQLGTPLVPPRQKKLKRKAGTVIVEEPQEFNPASNKQVKEVLENLGYRIPTRDGKETSDRTALLKLQRKNPSEFISLLLQHSRLEKLQSSYAKVILDGDRCMFSYNIGGTKSGRFSSSQTPWRTGLNIQTIPRKDDTYDLNFRRAFIPDPGMKMLQVDLSQAELRVVAWLSADPTLNKLLAENQDIHAYTSAAVSAISGLDCPRQLGKRLNHAANYGIGAEKFSDSCLLESDLFIPPDMARRLLEARAQTFPGIQAWHSRVEEQIRKTRRLETPHGRERYFFGPIMPDLLREAVSYLPQAIVVDTLNAAWVVLSRNPLYNIAFHVLQQGHDSLLLQVKEEALPDVVEAIQNSFAAQAIILHGQIQTIPWEITQGPTWGDLR